MDMTVQELIKRTEEFLKHAEALYKSESITYEEYHEMTHNKKNLLDQAKIHTMAPQVIEAYKNNSHTM
jgi:hypothetical protein